MRNVLIICVSAFAGFLGAMVALVFFGSPAVSAGPKTLTADTIRVSHLIVDGDIKVESKAEKVLEFTNEGGGRLEIANLVGTPGPDGKITPKTGSFIVRMGPDVHDPNVIVSDLGLAVTSRHDNDTFLTQLSGFNGLQLTYQQGLTPLFVTKLQPNRLAINSYAAKPAEIPSQRAINLEVNGLTCFKGLSEIVKCP